MVLERWQWPPTSNQHVSTLCTTPFKPLKILAKACLACLRGKQMTNHFFLKSSKNNNKLRRFLRSNTYTIWFDKYCSSCFLCLHRCLNTYSHLSLVKRLCKVVLETPLTLQTSFNKPYDNKDIKHVRLRTTVKTCVLFVPVLMQHKEFLQWPVLLIVRLQENNQPLKINVRAGSNEQKCMSE